MSYDRKPRPVQLNRLYGPRVHAVDSALYRAFVGGERTKVELVKRNKLKSEVEKLCAKSWR